jgi:hypothetical protein
MLKCLSITGLGEALPVNSHPCVTKHEPGQIGESSLRKQLGVQNCTDVHDDSEIPCVMPEKPTICPKCGDRVLEQVPGVELVAVHTPAITVVSPAPFYRCSRWHIFAIFSCATVGSPQSLKLHLYPLGTRSSAQFERVFPLTCPLAAPHVLAEIHTSEAHKCGTGAVTETGHTPAQYLCPGDRQNSISER